MDDKFANLLIDLCSKVLFLLWFWCVIISFLSEMIRILLGHQLHNMLLDIIYDQLLLFNGSMLDHGLQDSAAIVFIN